MSGRLPDDVLTLALACAAPRDVLALACASRAADATRAATRPTRSGASSGTSTTARCGRRRRCARRPRAAAAAAAAVVCAARARAARGAWRRFYFEFSLAWLEWAVAGCDGGPPRAPPAGAPPAGAAPARAARPARAAARGRARRAARRGVRPRAVPPPAPGLARDAARARGRRRDQDVDDIGHRAPRARTPRAVRAAPPAALARAGAPRRVRARPRGRARRGAPRGRAPHRRRRGLGRDLALPPPPPPVGARAGRCRAAGALLRSHRSRRAGHGAARRQVPRALRPRKPELARPLALLRRLRSSSRGSCCGPTGAGVTGMCARDARSRGRGARAL